MAIKKQKVSITQLLQDSIKSLRKEYNLRGDNLSRQLGKGASYISQLENGKIKEIEFDILIEIFKHIVNLSGNDFNSFIKNYIRDIVMDSTKNDLVNQNWIHLFVVQEYLYPITDFVREFITTKLEKTDKTPFDLVRYINQNNQNSSWNSNTYEPNKAYVNGSRSGSYAEDEYDLYISVDYKFENDYIEKILSEEYTTITYIRMKTIFRSLLEMEDKKYLAGVYEKTEKLLYDNGFLNTFELWDSLHDRIRADINATEGADLITFYDNILVDYQNKYENLKMELFENLENTLEHFYKFDRAYSCEKMEQISKNANTDPALLISMLSSPMYNVPREFRHYFFDDYIKLLNDYCKSKTDEK